MGNRNTFFAAVIVGIFLLAICLPLAGALLGKDRGLSYTEKRKLAQLPPPPSGYGGLADYIAGLEAYYNDQFGLRGVFMDSYRRLKKLIGDHDIGGGTGNVGTSNVIEGKEGWFFLNRKWDGDPFADYRNIDLYSEGELLRATLLFAARNQWLKSRGIGYLFFFAPNKHTIYSEYLPDYITKAGELSSWDQLNYALAEYTGVNFVDLRQPLLAGKDEAARYWRDNKGEAALYYRMDSHWNGAGADIAQYAVARKLAEMFPGKVEPRRRPPEDYLMRRFTGDITLIMGGTEEEAYGPHLPGSLCAALTREESLQRVHETFCPRGELDALVFNDSFLPPLKLHFSDYFRNVSYFWESLRLARVGEQLARRHPALIIEERAERFLPFTPDTRGEHYPEFWQKHWRKWRRSLIRLGGEELTEAELGPHNIRLGEDSGQSGLVVEAENEDPQLYLPPLEMEPDRLYLVRIVMTSPGATSLQLYYSSSDESIPFPEKNHVVAVPVAAGRNIVFVPLFSLYQGGRLRLDPGTVPGRYLLESLEIKELDWVDLRKD